MSDKLVKPEPVKDFKEYGSYVGSVVSETRDHSDQKCTIAEKVVKLLNQASVAIKDDDRTSSLFKVQELIINKHPDLLDSFSDEVVAFQADYASDVRKFVIGFMEEACKKDPELFSKFLPNLHILLVDGNTSVIKKVIQSSTQLFRLCLLWLSSSSKPKTILENAWKILQDILASILQLLHSENDGIRTQSVKFLEKVIITLSDRQRYSEIPRKSELCWFLDELPSNHELLNKGDIKALGEEAMQRLLLFVSSPAISSVNLMASLATLTTIAKQRPQFMATVVQAFETLHANLPPTLAKTQVTSVRKHLKMQLLNLLRHQASVEFHPQITNLLYDLGATSAEVSRNVPKTNLISKEKRSSSKKRAPVDDKHDDQREYVITKKPKIDLTDEYDVDDDDDDDDDETANSTNPVYHLPHSSAIDITADELVPLLTAENVANLVLLSMVMLPDKIPDAFQASYTPIESAGTMEQIMHLARLLSTQMTAVGIGSGVQYAAEMQAEKEEKKRLQNEKELMTKEKNMASVPIQTLIGGTTIKDETSQVEKLEKSEYVEPVPHMIPSRSLQRRMQGFHLAAVTKPLSIDVKDKIIKTAVLRILHAEKNAIAGGIQCKWQKILTSLVAQFGGDLHRSLANFILRDVRSRSKLAFQWVYEEFNIYLENSRGLNDHSAQENYDACLTSLLQGLIDKQDCKEGLFNKLVLQAPLLTDGVVDIVRTFCEDEKKVHSGILLIRELVLHRPPKRMQFLRLLLDLTTSNTEKVRNQAIMITQHFYENKDLYDLIEQYALTNLTFLKLSEPPTEIIKPQFGERKWTEDRVKQCMSLFLFLLPVNHLLIHKLADVYVDALADIKRVVLRGLETPVHGMGMCSPHLLSLVETCPKGAETLVTRMLHILTDREHPSAELVYRVRELYQKRVPDVRFLIPVLNGLEKHEVVLALPKLVRLNPPVVKGVFNRLLGVQRPENSMPSNSALSPIELLVALHNMEPAKVDMKCLIKATSLCFAEKSVYTSEVLVTVINHLVEQDIIPTLLMRTVIQALITYPRLSGFIMNVLQRLIVKRVWEQTKVWEGFIRCCQRMKPQSFQVLLQLPPAQLSNVFESVPELREPLLQHVIKFTPQQRQHISPAILSVLETMPQQCREEILAEMPTLEMEEQPRVTKEWEEQETANQEKHSTKSIHTLEEAMKVQEFEKTLSKQHERIVTATTFVNGTVKNEPQHESEISKAFPLDVNRTLAASVSVSTTIQSPIPATTSAITPHAVDVTSAVTPILPSLVTHLQTSVLMPPGVQSHAILSAPGVNLSLPPHLLHPLPETGVKQEQRSPTPTQDEYLEQI